MNGMVPDDRLPDDRGGVPGLDLSKNHPLLLLNNDTTPANFSGSGIISQIGESRNTETAAYGDQTNRQRTSKNR